MRFLPISVKIAARNDLFPADKLVWGVLALKQGREACAYASYKEIAEACGLSRRQALRSVKRLHVKGDISIKFSNAVHNEPNQFVVAEVYERNRRRVWAERKKKPLEIVRQGGDILSPP